MEKGNQLFTYIKSSRGNKFSVTAFTWTATNLSAEILLLGGRIGPATVLLESLIHRIFRSLWLCNQRVDTI